MQLMLTRESLGTVVLLAQWCFLTGVLAAWLFDIQLCLASVEKQSCPAPDGLSTDDPAPSLSVGQPLAQPSSDSVHVAGISADCGTTDSDGRNDDLEVAFLGCLIFCCGLFADIFEISRRRKHDHYRLRIFTSSATSRSGGG